MLENQINNRLKHEAITPALSLQPYTTKQNNLHTNRCPAFGVPDDGAADSGKEDHQIDNDEEHQNDNDGEDHQNDSNNDGILRAVKLAVVIKRNIIP